MGSRRAFLASGSAAAAAAWTFGSGAQGDENVDEINEATIAEAEKLAGVRYTAAERAQAVEDLRARVARYLARRAVDLGEVCPPVTVFHPITGGERVNQPNEVIANGGEPGPIPQDDRAIAYAPVATLSTWLGRGEISSRRLTQIYLERLRRIGPALECVVTLTEDRAMEQAERADREMSAGRRRGPLHGVPWGAKDLFDTAGIPTTWGAAPYRHRVPDRDAYVVERLDDAGAVLVAKLSLGAIAYGDIWFGGRTNNPWDPRVGSGGSSAGSAAATAAGLVGFSLGTETYGSIVTPCMRCGATGLRPTFGRVARTGAMALCWSLDKIGPICRTVQDCGLVLGAINGADAGDPSSTDVPFAFDARDPAQGLRLGYAPAWFEGDQVTDLERDVLPAAAKAGLELVEVELPDWPYDALMTILEAEAASAFEGLTLSDRDDDLTWQDDRAWPNTWRSARFIPAVEYIQAQRFRRRVCEMMLEHMAGVDALVSPPYAASLLVVTNCTGHPALTMRCGHRADGMPRGITLWGRLYDEGTLCRIGMALENRLGIRHRNPPM